MWTNWPQTEVAACIPALFWATERLVQRARATDAVLIAIVVGLPSFHTTLPQNFPSISSGSCQLRYEDKKFLLILQYARGTASELHHIAWIT